MTRKSEDQLFVAGDAHERPCTWGEREARVATSGFAITRARYAANAGVGMHEHERPGLTFVLSGSLRESFARRTLECGANTLIVKPPDARHRNEYGADGASCLIVEVLQPWIREQATALDRIGVWQGGTTAALARRLARETSPLMVEALALELVAAVAQTDDRAPAWLRRAHEYVHEQFRTIERVADIAAVAGVHPVHLARTYRARYGCSVADDVRRLRLEWAAAELVESDRAILEVAFDAGFVDQSHFTRAFAARFGITPARYRGQYSRKSLQTS
jgi:AraC family transcriptional regulator